MSCSTKDEPTVTITEREYFELEKARLRLEALEDAGVAHWDRYGKAIRALSIPEANPCG